VGIQLNRIIPGAPVSAFKTYSVNQGPDLMIRWTCEEIRCEAWLNGWRTLIDESTPFGQAQAAYIRHKAGRTFREQRDVGGLTVFTFESHQRCFAEHKTQPQRFGVRHGDFRGNPDGWSRAHANAADWLEDFAEHQQRVAADQARG
jgi:hypothetical protein